MFYVFLVLLIGMIAAAMIRTAMQNKKIRENGIVTDAYVSRIKEDEIIDADGLPSGTVMSYFVKYRTLDGEEVEATLGSGKSIDNQMTRNNWASDLYVGCLVKIMYLPERTDYVIRADQTSE